MGTGLPGAIKKMNAVQAMYEQRGLDSLLSSIARGDWPPEDRGGFRLEGTSVSPRKAREETVIAGHSGQPDFEVRLERIEARLSYLGVSLSYMEVSRNYIALRLEDAAEDVAYAGDTGLAFEEVRQLYADHYSASSGNSGLLAGVDAALGSIRASLAEIDARLAEIRSGVHQSRSEPLPYRDRPGQHRSRLGKDWCQHNSRGRAALGGRRRYGSADYWTYPITDFGALYTGQGDIVMRYKPSVRGGVMER